MASHLPAIEKLIGRANYDTWKFSVETFLQHEGLWKHVLTTDVTNSAEDTKARTKIILLLEPINYIHIQTATTAKEVWDNLEKVFNDSGLTRKVSLLRSLIMTRLDECDSIEEYVNKIVSTAHKLRGVGMAVSDEWVGTLLLAGLPELYKPMIMGIESSGVTISSDAIKTKLLQYVNTANSKIT